MLRKIEIEKHKIENTLNLFKEAEIKLKKTKDTGVKLIDVIPSGDNHFVYIFGLFKKGE